MMIRLIKYENIDKARWDKCIMEAANGLIYAESVYLDHMAENWEALVLGDYEAVMPITWKKKKGIRYCYQPAFFQQGGIFSSNPITYDTINRFLLALKANYKFGEINMNYLNDSTLQKSFYTTELRHNFVRTLGGGYDLIAASYNIYIRQRVSRAFKNNLVYQKSENHRLALDHFSNQYIDRIKGLRSEDIEKFKSLCDQLNLMNRLIVRAVYKKENNELLAVMLMLRDEKRIYNMASTLFEGGKKMLANYFLIDNIFREFGNEPVIFDFEGSDIPGIYFFYQKFAEQDQPYFFVRYNNLPFPLNLFKKR